MKKIHFILLAFVFLVPLGLSAQSMNGSWISEGADEEGNTWKNMVTFGDDGAFTIDFRNDGEVDVVGTFVQEGNTVKVNDSSEESPCYGKTGVYSVQFEGNQVTVTMVEDPCEQRANEKPWTMTRM